MKIVFQSEGERPTTSVDGMVFVEVEDNAGNSINAGTWGSHPDDDGLHTLTISADAHIAALAESLLEIDQRQRLEGLLANQQTPRQWQRLTPGELHVLEMYRGVRQGIHLEFTVANPSRRNLDDATILGDEYRRTTLGSSN